MHSIRFKAIAITIAAVLTAVLSVSVVSFLIISDAVEQRSAEMMNLMAVDAGKSIEKYTDGIQQSVELTSNLAVDALDGVLLTRGGVIGTGAGLDGRTSEQISQIDSYLASYVKQVQAQFASVASHTGGAITYYYCISPAVSQSEHGFFYSRVGRTGFGPREPIDASTLDPSDGEHDVWYYTPIKRGCPTWVGPYAARYLQDKSVFSYEVPVYKSGTLIGVLGMDIPLEEMSSLVADVRVYETGFACLLDANGKVLYHPAQKAGTTVRLPIDTKLLQQENNGSALISYSTAGTEYLMSFTTLATGMKLVIVAPASEVHAPTVRLTHMIPPVAVVVVLLFAFITFLAIRHITDPLLRLTSAAHRLTSADYDVELDYRSDDEVGLLTDAFKSMREQLQTSIADLNRRVQTDDLTGLSNQRHFFELATEERQRLVERGQEPVLLYINIVGMKQFNRQFGYDEGDRIIRKEARILARHFGERNSSRFAQDHFAVITSNDNLEQRLHALFDECSLAHEVSSPPVSVGIYQYRMGEVETSEACDRAKHACDRRRGSYYSGYRYFDQGMLKQIDLYRYVVSHVDQAIANRWIKVYYQPIVRADDGRLCDEEALSRWVDQKHGYLSPADFIPALESSGLIYKLDLYVLDEVLDKIRRHKRIGIPVVPQSINLSRSDFDVIDVVEEIRSRVDAAGVERDLITIEITESIIGGDFAFMKEQVERFQVLGFHVWMDDFGSGYSSLSFLQSIRFDLLKFDMSFLRHLGDREESRIILRELMQMAVALGVGTLCEGVETPEQMGFLREIGCSKLQGYLIGKPMPLVEEETGLVDK